MSFKYKAFIWIGTLLVLFVFRYEIAAHFNLEELLPANEKAGIASVVLENDKPTTKEPQAPQLLPAQLLITENNTTIYRNPGSSVMGTGNAGHQVSVIDTEDTGQKYINVRFNGFAGYINRSKLNINKDGKLDDDDK